MSEVLIKKLAKYTVLIAEDDQLLRDALTLSAEEAGLKVVTAVDGQDALTRAQRQMFHGILVDMNLPRLMGHQVIEALREKGPCKDSVIVVLSGYLKKEVVQAIAGKVQKAFTKPADVELVVAALKSLIEERNG